MKRKMFILAVLMMLAVLMAAPVWAARQVESDGDVSQNVTVQVNIPETVGINVPTTTVVFNVTAANLAAAPMTKDADIGNNQTIEYFCNTPATWSFKSQASGNLSDGTNTIPIARLKHALSGSDQVTFGDTSLTNGLTTHGAAYTKTTGWDSSTIAYKLDVVGDETASVVGTPYATTITYTVTTP